MSSYVHVAERISSVLGWLLAATDPLPIPLLYLQYSIRKGSHAVLGGRLVQYSQWVYMCNSHIHGGRSVCRYTWLHIRTCIGERDTIYVHADTHTYTFTPIQLHMYADPHPHPQTDTHKDTTPVLHPLGWSCCSPFQQAKVRGMLFSLPEGTFTSALESSRILATL